MREYRILSPITDGKFRTPEDAAAELDINRKQLWHCLQDIDTVEADIVTEWRIDERGLTFAIVTEKTEEGDPNGAKKETAKPNIL